MQKISYLNEAQAAEALNLAKTTLSRWRWSGKGPRYVKFGGAIRYPSDGIEEFVSQSIN